MKKEVVSTNNGKPLLGAMPKEERERFYWHQESKESKEDEELEKPSSQRKTIYVNIPLQRDFLLYLNSSINNCNKTVAILFCGQCLQVGRQLQLKVL